MVSCIGYGSGRTENRVECSYWCRTRCVMILLRCHTVVCVVATWALQKPATKCSDVLFGLVGVWTPYDFVVVAHNVVHIIVASCLVVVHCSRSLLALRLNG